MGTLFSKPTVNGLADARQQHPPPEQQIHIAIVGAGIGGLALAIALDNRNVPYTLYESASEYATVGAGVGIGPNAMRAMDMIDRRFRGKYDEVCIGNLTPGKEHVMMEAYLMGEGLGTESGWTPKPWGSPIYTRTAAHRKTLLDIMTSFIPRETVKFNKKVSGIEQTPNGVTVIFEDGQSVQASAVIG
jgi:salicylate hydroxylase